ncbi:hypothetical protein [Corynebacterium flavescens]|uniref:hypothetical protein n=1 Tax=Corynebacterium flavescens TaxID=28028 RepID=UPI00289789ED|nr:hypothetical protein [Corynebacterium flavescens]
MSGSTGAAAGGEGTNQATPNTAAAAAAQAQPAQDSARQGAQQAEGTKEFTPPSSQEDLDRIIESRLARERAKFSGFDELKTKAERYDKLEDAKKTDEQRSAERIAALESQLAETRLEGARARIAASAGVDPDLLAGSSEEELTAHAEKLSAALKSAAETAAPTNTAPKAFGEGRGGGSTSSQSGDWIRDALSAR